MAERIIGKELARMVGEAMSLPVDPNGDAGTLATARRLKGDHDDAQMDCPASRLGECEHGVPLSQIPVMTDDG